MGIYGYGLSPSPDGSNVLTPAIDNGRLGATETENTGPEEDKRDTNSDFPNGGDATEDKLDAIPLRGWLCCPGDWLVTQNHLRS